MAGDPSCLQTISLSLFTEETEKATKNTDFRLCDGHHLILWQGELMFSSSAGYKQVESLELRSVDA